MLGPSKGIDELATRYILALFTKQECSGNHMGISPHTHTKEQKESIAERVSIYFHEGEERMSKSANWSVQLMLIMHRSNIFLLS